VASLPTLPTGLAISCSQIGDGETKRIARKLANIIRIPVGAGIRSFDRNGRNLVPRGGLSHELSNNSKINGLTLPKIKLFVPRECADVDGGERRRYCKTWRIAIFAYSATSNCFARPLRVAQT
jgi:hypothetical protein